jgi:LysM repeat protein
VVQSGENLTTIAVRYGVRVTQLMQANGLTSTSVLHPGDKLIIPAKRQTPTPTTVLTEVIHVVQEGEGLADISQRYSVPPERIREANDLSPSSTIRPGDRLTIPLTPPPTATPIPVATTSTPGPPYPAPHLLSPAHKARFKGQDAVLVLQWASVGILEDDEWYAVRLRYLGSWKDDRPKEEAMLTRITSWRVPKEWYPREDDLGDLFEWTVEVVRIKDNTDAPVLICPPGTVRRFEWR